MKGSGASAVIGIMALRFKCACFLVILFLEERFNNSMTGLFAKHNACILAAPKGKKYH